MHGLACEAGAGAAGLGGGDGGAGAAGAGMATIDIDAEDMVIIGGCSDGEEDAIAVQSRVAGLKTVVKSSLEVGMRRSRRSIGGQPIPLGLPMRALSPPQTTAKASTKRSPLGSSGNPNPLKDAPATRSRRAQ